MRFSPTGEVVPDLAETWSLIDDVTIEFVLRQGVSFHNGTPFSADDVLFSFDRILNRDTGATQRANIETLVSSIEKLGDHVVRLHLRKPAVPIFEVLARPEVAMVSKVFVESGGDYTREFMGTGPFRVLRIEEEVVYVLERNPDYFREGLPYLDQLRLIPLEDDGARINALYAGEVDFIQYVPTQHMSLVEAAPQWQYWSGDAVFMGLFLNTQRAPFDDVRVRRAIAYAIDRDGVIAGAYDGRGSAITGGLLPAGTWGHNEDLVGTFAHDPARARALLAEAGYPNGFDVRMVTASIAIHARPAEVVQAQLRSVGINMTLEVVEVAVMTERRARGEYDVLIWGASPQMNDPDLYAAYFLSGAPGMYAGPTSFSDETLDDLLLRGRASFDQVERKEIYHQFEERLLELAPVAFMNWREQGFAGQDYVRGFQMIPGVMGNISEIAYEHTWLDR